MMVVAEAEKVHQAMEAVRPLEVHRVIMTEDTIMVKVVMHLEMRILAILTAVPQVKMVKQMIRLMMEVMTSHPVRVHQAIMTQRAGTILMMVVMPMEMTGILAMLRAVPQMEPKLAGIRQAMMVVAEAERVHQAIMTQRAGTILMMA